MYKEKQVEFERMNKRVTVNQYLILILAFLLHLFSESLFAERAVYDSLRATLNQAKNSDEQIEIETQLAHWYLYVNADSVRYYLNSAVRKSIKINDDILLCYAYIKYSALYATFPEIASIDSSMYYLDLAHRIAEKNSYRKGMATCFFYKGYYLMETNEKEKAIDYLLKGRIIFAQLEDTASLIQIDNFIGQLYRLTGDYDKAISAFENIEKTNEAKSWSYYPVFLEIMGETYELSKKYERGLEYYKKAYALTLKYGDRCDIQRVLMKIASAFHCLKNTDSTNYYFDKTVSYTDSCAQEGGFANNCVILADISFDNKQYAEAEKYYLKSLELIRRNSWTDYELYTLKRLSNFYEVTKNYSKAFDYLQQYIQLKDSMKVESLSYLLDKALTDQELKGKIDELGRLKIEQAKMIKSNGIILSYCLMAVLLFLIIWYLIAGMLFKFSKNHIKKGNAATIKYLWNYVPPQYMQTNKVLGLISLVFTILTFASYKLVIPANISIIRLIIFCIISGWLFFIVEITVVYFQKKKKELPFKKELIQQLIWVPLFVFVVSGTEWLLTGIEFNKFHFVYLSVLLTGNYFISYTIQIFLLYRQRMEKLNELFVEEFKQKLQLHSKQAIKAEVNELKQEIVAINNAGKNTEIDLNTVVYIVSDNIYQEFVCYENGKTTKILVRNTLSTIENQLKNFPEFLRCHRSYIVNTQNIVSIDGNSRQQYFLLDIVNEKIPISRSLTSEILFQFDTLIGN